MIIMLAPVFALIWLALFLLLVGVGFGYSPFAPPFKYFPLLLAAALIWLPIGGFIGWLRGDLN